MSRLERNFYPIGHDRAHPYGGISARVDERE
jgi:hypothetical protein